MLVRATEAGASAIRAALLCLWERELQASSLSGVGLGIRDSHSSPESRVPIPAWHHDLRCGPEPMLEAVAHVAARYKRPSQVSVERVMGCGMGGCYSCVIPVRDGQAAHHYVRSCIAGPVFRGDDIVWD